MTHTPGPWVYDESRIWGGDSAVSLVAEVGYHPERPHEHAANARLIAAAPDLLLNLELLLAFVEQFRPPVDGPVFDDVRAAIAKAKGES